MTLAARLALTAARAWSAHDVIADRPRVHLVADRNDDPTPLVTFDRALASPAVEDHVQIAAAHAAVAHFDQHLARPDGGDRNVFDLELALGLVDDGRHGGREAHAVASVSRS